MLHTRAERIVGKFLHLLLLLFCHKNVLFTNINNYVGPLYCRAEVYAGRVAL